MKNKIDPLRLIEFSVTQQTASDPVFAKDKDDGRKQWMVAADGFLTTITEKAGINLIVVFQPIQVYICV